jgi:hypothetical protein
MLRSLAVITALGSAVAQDGSNTIATTCPDINGDQFVDVNDLLALLAQYGNAVTADTTGDINSDGAVNVQDLLLLLAGFGQTCDDSAPGAPWSGEVARLSFEEADAHLNAANGHIYVDFGDDYYNRLDSTIAPHELANAGQFNPVSYAACSRGTNEVGFKTFFDGANANTDTGGRWNIGTQLTQPCLVVGHALTSRRCPHTYPRR